MVYREKIQNSILTDKPCMEQISSKYILPSVSSNRYMAKFVLDTFNIFVTSCPFLIKLLLVLSCGPAINSHKNIYNKVKVHFQIFLSETNEPKKWNLKLEFSYWQFPAEETALCSLVLSGAKHEQWNDFNILFRDDQGSERW